MQDNCSRFIMESIRQAQCDYEPIDTSCGCGNKAAASNDCASDVQDARYRRRDCEGNVASARKKHCECEFTQGEDCDIPVMVFIQPQDFCRMYNEVEGLCRGTMFPALDKPFLAKGGTGCGR